MIELTLREALEWYSRPTSYAVTQAREPRSAIHEDQGQKAVFALEQLDALEHYIASLVSALEWYTIDDHYRGHDPEILYDVGCIARDALGGDRS